MSSKLKTVPAFFVLFALLFIGVFVPLFISEDSSVLTSGQETGVLAAIRYNPGGFCFPENKKETYITGEKRPLPGLVTGFFTPTVYAGVFAPVYYLISSDLEHINLNPVRIAEYFHLSDGMK